MVNMLSINARLARWAIETADAYPEYIYGNNFWCCQLRMHYNLALLHLHRNFVVPDIAVTGGQDSQSICNDAAEAILGCLSAISSLGALSQVTTYGRDGRDIGRHSHLQQHQGRPAEGSHIVALGALDGSRGSFQYAKELAAFWPNADAVYQIFDGIHKEFEAHVMQGIAAGG